MKITKTQLKRIIKEELGAMRESDEETGPDLSYEEQEQFRAAYQEINGPNGSKLSEPTRDAVREMMYKLDLPVL